KDSLLDFFGTKINDPYLWLEDDNSEATHQWVDAENKVTRSYLDSIPFRQKIKDRYTDLFNFEKVGAPIKAGENFFIYKNSGLEPQGKYFIRKGLDGPEELFLDINALSTNGTVSAELMAPSDDNKYIAVNISEAGSDWSKIVVYDIATRQPTGDELKWVKFSGAAWYNNGFYYSRYPEPATGKALSGNNQNHIVYYHRLGQPQSEDKLIYSDPSRPNMYHNVYLTEDKKFLVLIAAPGTDGYEVYLKNPADTKAPFKALFTDVSLHNSVIESTIDGHLLVLTDVDAPRYRLVKVDPSHPEKEKWKELIPQNENLLQSVSTCGGRLFASYLDKANTRIYQLNYDGSEKKEIPLPANTGTAGGFNGKKEDSFCFYSFTSFTYPGVIYRYDITTGNSTEYYTPKVKFNPEDYESNQIMYKSKDGTEVPMFIVHKKGLKKDGSNPTLLYGYGGFNISLTPGFSASRIVLLENGGVFAMANLRGGGEFGEDWHKAGMKDNKQNVFDDFIGAAEYLIKEGYTSKDKLAIEGGSNGGLLVGACMTQRPDLFKVAFPEVGVLDMLRFHHFTVGKGWIPEYGCADSSKTQFEYLNAYSPYHNLKPETTYPATMIMTADHDDRVVPAHSFKFAARLQEYHKGENPVLIRIEKSAGHGAGKSTDQIIEEQTDKWAFFFYNLRKDI
ncbi:MAG: S9 family peptidase, partial [Crocinitomicaceae bacterium]|nr:S9 family peptidase [Crocinitomicaceae bacterium]